MPVQSLSGRVAVVTGAAGGIGSAIASRLSRDGASVVLVDLDGDRASALAGRLGGEAIGVQADVSHEEDVERYMDAAVERFGRVDLHHLNAGIPGSAAALPDLGAEEFDRLIAMNLRGTFLGLRAAFRQYFLQGSGGAIVVTGSIATLRGRSDLLPDHASKHGVLGLMRNAAAYGGPLGVRVNAIAPGLVPTALFGPGRGPGGGGDMVKRASTTPMRKVANPEEIASVVAFLLSDDAAYTTGEVISVDGGASIVVNSVRPSGGAGAWDTTVQDARIAARS
ncbi:SDR family NAD(P)-dependent oxidoreductase [Pseudonocardia sp.]|jgi:NAD(P)-dependent dehydrogenase (short-subunit alcohol dehydrogenase family)|uniref:SDR family NAD(P)-dependent oxidoreductase n=1 Tax=Pseudonocardia sp. TaxID=60912 RepID=UPI002D92FFD8|nr:SDR family NAD(P)-dependent oxidoreductase [Pseudonocardia sp.]